MGCGAIGSRIAQSIVDDLSSICRLTALHDQDRSRAQRLQQCLQQDQLVCDTLDDLLARCDLMVEAVSSPHTRDLVQAALTARRDVLVMSVGQMLNATDLFRLASKNHCAILIPSGAVAGIDAVKSACLAPLHHITLTTRKPISGFANNQYVQEQGIDLAAIQGERVLFEGGVDDAVRHFPRNINVAATLALASQAKDRLTIRIITSPDFQVNSHEIEAVGDFGRMVSRTENVICPDNPKTSYLAVLSGIQTLKEFCSGIQIGT